MITPGRVFHNFDYDVLTGGGIDMGGSHFCFYFTVVALVKGNSVEVDTTGTRRVKLSAADSRNTIGIALQDAPINTWAWIAVIGTGSIKMKAGATAARGDLIYQSDSAGEAFAVAPAAATADQLSKMIGYCNETIGAGATGSIVVVTNRVKPENSTVANVGTGAGLVYRDMTTNQINLKTIKAGTSVSVTNNADDITIANTAPEATTVANVGTGAGLSYRDMSGAQINLKTVKAGASVSVTNNADDITIANTAPENTTVANVGTGAGLVWKTPIVAGLVNLKTIKAGASVSVTNNADDITIANTAPENTTAANVGAGTGLVWQTPIVAGLLNFKSILASTNMAVTNNANDVTLAVKPNFALAAVALVDAGPIVVDASTGCLFSVTITANRQFQNPSNPTSGQKIIFRVKQNAAGSKLVTWDGKYRFSTDLPAPTASTGANLTDYFGFIYHSTDDKWDYVAEVKGFT